VSTKRRKRHGPEEIVRKLRDEDAMLSAGKDLAAVLQALEVKRAARRRASRDQADEGTCARASAVRLRQFAARDEPPNAAGRNLQDRSNFSHIDHARGQTFGAILATTVTVRRQYGMQSSSTTCSGGMLSPPTFGSYHDGKD